MNVKAPSLPWSVSLGNVLTIGTTLILVSGYFFTTDNRTQANAKSIDDLSLVVGELSQSLRGELIDIESRLRTLEQKDARNDERLTNMLALLSRIDSRLERLEERLP